jgi:hypothetical protein
MASDEPAPDDRGVGADNARYPPEGDPPGDPLDIPGYPGGDDIPGYPGGDEQGPSDADIDRYRGMTPLEAIQDQPLFKDSGFDSIEEYLDHLDDLSRARLGLPALYPRQLPPVSPQDGRGSRQVGLRLPEADHRQLRELADEHGLAPATLARMIVVRAVRANRVEPPD